MDPASRLVAIVKHGPHSFERIREKTSLKLTDEQFAALVAEHPDRFAPVRFQRRDDEGKRIGPGRPGVKLK